MAFAVMALGWVLQQSTPRPYLSDGETFVAVYTLGIFLIVSTAILGLVAAVRFVFAPISQKRQAHPHTQLAPPESVRMDRHTAVGAQGARRFA